MCQRLKLDYIKSVSALAPKSGNVGCGNCEECRTVKKNSWVFRLRVEFEALKAKGWNISFCTLTYDDNHLPRVPRYFCKSDDVEPFMCFSREHVNKFVKSLTNWMYREYKLCDDDKLRFLICSEYGEATKRSHYHALFCTPPQIPVRTFYDKVKSAWNHGFLFPRFFDGGVDGHGYNHMPFVVDCAFAACSYAAKYICKDIGYYRDIDLSKYYWSVTDWENNEDKLSRYLPFHSQSRSLGLAWLKSLPEDKLLQYLNDGYSFVGDDRLRQLPVYLKNKIIFNNYYVFDKSGKRLCRRMSSEFFHKHRREIYEKKVDYIESKIEKWRNFRFQSLGHENNDLLGELHSLGCAIAKCPREIARDYLAFGGVPADQCYDVDRCDFWYSRYNYVTDGKEVCDIDLSGYTPISPVYLCYLNRFFELGAQLDVEYRKFSDFLARQKSLMIDKVRDYYKSSA